MSEQTPTNLSNADFTFKDKYGNTGKTKGVSTNDSTKLNNMVKLMNLILQTPNSADFINTLATKQNVEEVIQALTLKADTDLSNISNVAQSFKDMSVGWGMPDYDSAIQLNHNRVYQANVDCLITVQANISNAYFGILVNSIKSFPSSIVDYSTGCKRIACYGGNFPASNGLLNPTIHGFVPKGKYFKIYTSGNDIGSEIFLIQKIPLKGVN